MIQLPKVQANIDDIATWAKYSRKLCGHCVASCCSLQVEVKAVDLVRMGLVDEFELEEPPKNIARRLLKERLIERYHSKTATYSLPRMANGDCVYLDCKTRQCTIYQQRPDTCRNHPRIGPRSGYCAFKMRSGENRS